MRVGRRAIADLENKVTTKSPAGFGWIILLAAPIRVLTAKANLD
jgi:hypothetical protein